MATGPLRRSIEELTKWLPTQITRPSASNSTELMNEAHKFFAKAYELSEGLMQVEFMMQARGGRPESELLIDAMDVAALVLRHVRFLLSKLQNLEQMYAAKGGAPKRAKWLGEDLNENIISLAVMINAYQVMVDSFRQCMGMLDKPRFRRVIEEQLEQGLPELLFLLYCDLAHKVAVLTAGKPSKAANSRLVASVHLLMYLMWMWHAAAPSNSAALRPLGAPDLLRMTTEYIGASWEELKPELQPGSRFRSSSSSNQGDTASPRLVPQPLTDVLDTPEWIQNVGRAVEVLRAQLSTACSAAALIQQDVADMLALMCDLTQHVLQAPSSVAPNMRLEACLDIVFMLVTAPCPSPPCTSTSGSASRSGGDAGSSSTSSNSTTTAQDANIYEGGSGSSSNGAYLISTLQGEQGVGIANLACRVLSCSTLQPYVSMPPPPRGGDLLQARLGCRFPAASARQMPEEQAVGYLAGRLLAVVHSTLQAANQAGDSSRALTAYLQPSLFSSLEAAAKAQGLTLKSPAPPASADTSQPAEDAKQHSPDASSTIPSTASTCLEVMQQLVDAGLADNKSAGCWNTLCPSATAKSKPASSSKLKLKSCANCHAARYCCTECQRAAWRGGHREVCLRLQAMVARRQAAAPSSETEDTRA